MYINTIVMMHILDIEYMALVCKKCEKNRKFGLSAYYRYYPYYRHPQKSPHKEGYVFDYKR